MEMIPSESTVLDEPPRPTLNSSPPTNSATPLDSDAESGCGGCLSESDALVIDEGQNLLAVNATLIPPSKRPMVNGGKSDENDDFDEDEDDENTVENPYFNQSIFELSQQHRPRKSPAKLKKKTKKMKKQNSTKVLDNVNVPKSIVAEDPSLSMVFLCSSCGEYFEGGNLYIHMVKMHRRHICLYCLGLFRLLDDLCTHLQSRHKVTVPHRATPEQFYDVHPGASCLVCCECDAIFSERDDFFYHVCSINQKSSRFGFPAKNINKQPPPISLGRHHVTAENTPTVSVSSFAGFDRRQQEFVPEFLEFYQHQFEQPKKTAKIPTVDDNYDDNYAEEDDVEQEEDLEESNRTGSRESFKEDCHENDEISPSPPPPEEETRKVPKLSLKLKLGGIYPEIHRISPSTDEEAYCYEEEEEAEAEEEVEDEEEDQPMDELEKSEEPLEEEIQVADSDISVVELCDLDQPLDRIEPKHLVQRCLLATAPICIYCNHARKIRVNGKQLALHAIAQHRYSAVVRSITAEELIPESFVARLRSSLSELNDYSFNLLEGYAHNGYECFQCRFVCPVHKELYVHNRKAHSNTNNNLLLCIMCKLSFYTYSELLCHLCAGVYLPGHATDPQFQCCFCASAPVPSAFRLMVHIRKRHNVCDVCLEVCHNQVRLSAHVWKHKVHHFCYRCGIAYRNKPDITRHLFWKHGTESVVCKRCLQKKWPHVYHFCIPPERFSCDQCPQEVHSAMALRIHKRLHSDVPAPHQCHLDGCSKAFISKRLLAKHQHRHGESEEDLVEETVVDVVEEPLVVAEQLPPPPPSEESKIEDESEPAKKLVNDLYNDLPELKLSESDSSSDEEQTPASSNGTKQATSVDEEKDGVGVEAIVENVWEDFKNYQASKEKFDSMLGGNTDKEDQEKDIAEEAVILPNAEEEEEPSQELTLGQIVGMDHDYCYIPPEAEDYENQAGKDTQLVETEPVLNDSADHDYCSPKDPTRIDSGIPPNLENNNAATTADTAAFASSSSSSSSDSSCSCGPNCSCSSSSSDSSSSSSTSEDSGSESDSSTEEGRQKQRLKREKKLLQKKKQSTTPTGNNNTLEKAEISASVEAVPQPPPTTTTVRVVRKREQFIHESDLTTTESDTDEDFYDKCPQIIARKLLEEKRMQLLANMSSSTNGSAIPLPPPPPPPTPSFDDSSSRKQRRKLSKMKKRKRKKRHQKVLSPLPITLTISKGVNVSMANQAYFTPNHNNTYNSTKSSTSTKMSDPNKRSSKRRRVPNKFYGYSSDEEAGGVGGGGNIMNTNTTTTITANHVAAAPAFSSSNHHSHRHRRHHQHNSNKWSRKSSSTTAYNGDGGVGAMLVPPITIRTNTNHNRESLPATPTGLKVRLPKFPHMNNSGKSAPLPHHHQQQMRYRPPAPPPPSAPLNRNALYCYCKCPYDEVSEMIGCDSKDCEIEWFHFECVGIMVPPKGHWYCPECRKKRQQELARLKKPPTNPTTTMMIGSAPPVGFKIPPTIARFSAEDPNNTI